MVPATRAYEAPKTSWKGGRATLTTVTSRIDMIAPRTTTPAIFRTAPSILSGTPVVCGDALVALLGPLLTWRTYQFAKRDRIELRRGVAQAIHEQVEHAAGLCALCGFARHQRHSAERQQHVQRFDVTANGARLRFRFVLSVVCFVV